MNSICTKCGHKFPTRITLNGRRYSLSNRKNCLTCVPFKSKNGTGRLYSNWSDERKARHRAVAAAKGLKRKRQLVEIKGGKCQICGYNKCLRALHFHHRNPKEKSFEISSSEIKNKNWDVILIELDKCDLVCSNCHCEIHDKEFAHYIDVKVGTSPGEGQTNFPCNECGVDRKFKSPNNLCDACSKKKKRKVQRPSLETLKSKIKELGYCGTGRFYGVSDNAIRKWIKFYETNALVTRMD